MIDRFHRHAFKIPNARATSAKGMSRITPLAANRHPTKVGREMINNRIATILASPQATLKVRRIAPKNSQTNKTIAYLFRPISDTVPDCFVTLKKSLCGKWTRGWITRAIHLNSEPSTRKRSSQSRGFDICHHIAVDILMYHRCRR